MPPNPQKLSNSAAVAAAALAGFGSAVVELQTEPPFLVDQPVNSYLKVLNTQLGSPNKGRIVIFLTAILGLLYQEFWGLVCLGAILGLLYSRAWAIVSCSDSECITEPVT